MTEIGKIDEIKKKFINFMESIHEGTLFPKKFFGCMMAVFIEQEPVTQERIEMLTSYSKATISQMLKLISISYPLNQIKKPGIRKKYYSISLEPREFMRKFLKTMLDQYTNKADFILPLIKQIEPYVNRHENFLKLTGFLKKFYESAEEYTTLLKTTENDFKSLIHTGMIDASGLLEINLLDSNENLKYIQNLLNPPKPTISVKPIPMDETNFNLYLQFKYEFYQKFREHLLSGESQIMVARGIIGTELLLESRPLTQSEIEKATKIPRSIISEALKLLSDMKMIQIIKIPGDRKKYYYAIQSWDSRMISKFRVNVKYAWMVKNQITGILNQLSSVPLNQETKSLKDFLKEIYGSYHQYAQYFKFLELKFLNMRLNQRK